MNWAFLDPDVPFAIAHRGGDDVAPGNTEASFDHAVSLGYRYIETDVQVTSDGVLVMFHDDDLEAETGFAGKIEDLTFAQVGDLRLGDDHPIPVFDEMIRRFPEVHFNIEPKADSAVEPLISAIREHDLHDRVCIGSFDDARVRRVKEALGPNLATSPGPAGLAGLVARSALRRGGPVPHAAVQIPTSYSGVPLASSRALINRFQRLGLQVHVWTINDETEMVKLLDNGVDAIMTDRTELLREVLRARGQWD